MQRRKFLRFSVLASSTLALPNFLRGQVCSDTTRTDKYGKGPFYIPGAPYRAKLAPDHEPGQRICIDGTVSNCNGPLIGANLDIWHATASGCYKYPNANCPDLPGHPDAFRLRGQVLTDSNGKYSVETIMPGAYLNGAQYRPRHLHIIITHATLSNAGLVTQLYFEGDPYIASDYAAGDPSATNRIIPLEKHTTSPWQGTWNIKLPVVSAGIDFSTDPAYKDFDILVERMGDQIRFHLPTHSSHQPVEVRLYNFSGILLQKSVQKSLQPTVKTAHLNPGAYLVGLGWWTSNGFRTESVPVSVY